MKSKLIWLLILSTSLFGYSWISCSPSSSSPSVGGQLGFDCDFENDHDLCGWHVLGGSSSNQSWYRTTNGIVESKQSGAWLTTSQLDRSLGLNNQNEFQTLASKVPLKGSSAYCLSFRYYLLAIEDRSNFVVLRSTTADLPTDKMESYSDFESLWKADQRNAPTWTRQHVRIVLEPRVYSDHSFPYAQHSQNVDYYLMFVGTIQEGHANIGLDDIRLFEGDCPVVDENFCDFELNTCGWQLNGTQVWSNYIDHTTSTVTGHHVRFADDFRLIPSNWNKTGIMTKSLSTLRMFANKNDNRQQVCLQFFYYMGSEFVETETLKSVILEPNGSISVKVTNGVETIASYNISLMDTYNSGYLEMWTMFRANFEAPKSATIEIESHRTVELTKVKFDDIRFSAGQCEVQGNCDFETDMCGWINYEAWTHGHWSFNGVDKHVDSALWLRVQANSGYIIGGHLLQDRTTRSITGNYLLLPLAMLDGEKKDSLKLTSPLISNDKLNNKMCFTMWYFVQTRDTLMEAIEVQLKDIRQRQTSSTHATGTHSLEWKLFSVQFDNLPERFQVEVRVLHHENILSNVGLDDIRLVPGDC